MEQNKIADGYMFKMENDPRIIGSEKGLGKELVILSGKHLWMSSHSFGMGLKEIWH